MGPELRVGRDRDLAKAWRERGRAGSSGNLNDLADGGGMSCWIPQIDRTGNIIFQNSYNIGDHLQD